MNEEAIARYGRILVVAAVVVSAPRYASAFAAADAGSIAADGNVAAALHFATVLSGAFMGIVEVLAAVFLLAALGTIPPTFNRTRKGQPVVVKNRRYNGVLFFVVGLHVISVIIIAPYIVSNFPTVDGLSGALFGSTAVFYVWSLAVTVAPLFVVGGVEFSGYGLLGSAGKKPPKKVSKVRHISGQEPRKKATQDQQVNTPPQVATAVTLEEGDGTPIGDFRLIKKSPILLRQIADMTPQEVAADPRFSVKTRAARDWPTRASAELAKLNGSAVQGDRL